MSQALAHHFTAEDYERVASEYCRSLPLEHFMEGKPQSLQRNITNQSFEVLNLRRPDIQWFSEMLVLYWHHGKLQKVCPDNMLVISGEPCQAQGSFAVELEPAEPFLVKETVSPRSDRKDYHDNFVKYESELCVPYCVIFDPADEKLDVFKNHGNRYEALTPDADGRCYVPEIDLHIGLLDGWVRFWYQGELLPVQTEVQELIESQQEQLVAKDEQIQQRDQQIRQRDQQIQQRDQQLDQLIQLLRSEIEIKARRHGRDDILGELSSTADVAKLQQWLIELGKPS